MSTGKQKVFSSSPPMPGAPTPAPGSEDSTRAAARLEQEIEHIRENLGGLVSELEHRRHRLNPKAALVNHPLAAAAAAALLAGAVAGGIVWRRAHLKRRNSWAARTKRLRIALRRAVDKPDKVAEAEPNLAMKVFSAAATAVATMAARRLAAMPFT